MELKPVIPFEPVRTEVIPSGSNWVAQVKWDGVRILTYYDGHETRLINRKGNERSRQYPEFNDVPSYCQAHSVILDGEMIALAGGKPSFHEIMKRDSLRREQEISFAVGRTMAIYMIFDILYYNGQWVTSETLEHRQQHLQSIISPHSALQLVPNVQDGEALFTVMKERGWEGMVCKRLDSSYLIGGKDSRWQKLKLGYDLYAAIGGVTYRDGIVNALLLGVYNQEGNFIYIGHAGGGKLKVVDLRELTGIIQTMIREKTPFVNQPQRVKGAIWVQPTLSVKVQFMEWTPGGTMRHPVIQGMAIVPPEMCVVTQIE